MTLLLSILAGPAILAGPDDAAPEKRVSPEAPFSLGRAPDNDWMLADPQRHLSKRHCTIAFRDSFWEVTDHSTNGTFLNAEREPIGHDGVRDLRDGDRLRLGGYEIAVAIAEAPPVMRSDTPLPVMRGDSALPFDVLEADPFEGPPQPDHSPGIEDAFVAPRPVVLLGEDWDLGDSALPAPASAPAPVLSPALAPEIAPSDPTDLMAAFLRGTGLRDVSPPEPAAAMEALGAAFRAFASGLRETLAARAAIKSEFRIEQTMIQARGNNPLKFSASDDDALLALIGAGRRSDTGPAEAVAEAFRDIRLHELAVMAAMQTAVRGMFRELAPDKLLDGAGSSVLPSHRKVRAWDAFVSAHTRMTQALSDNFDSAFGRAFTRAYEQALRETRR
jgi:type VI secretion system protein ImpI/type VI secretion system protein